MFQMLAEYILLPGIWACMGSGLDEVPLPDVEQERSTGSSLYWARSDELFTSTRVVIAHHSELATH